MNDILKRCLDDLEARIDPQEEDAILQAWRDFSENRFRGDIFSPRRSQPNPPQVEWPHVSVNAALADKPETINEDAYGEGWLFVLEPSEPDQLNELLSPDDYAQLLEDEG